MSVIHAGLALAGVLGVSIPIIIHLLFRQRRRPIEWGAMRFLMEAFRRARRRMQLEQLLLLLIRCVMVLLFALAIGRLYFSGAGGGAAAGLFGGGGRTVYLLIDNGVTSGAVLDPTATATAAGAGGGNAGTVLGKHKAAAREILSALGPSDRVSVITLARPVESLVEPPALDHRAVRDLIDGITPSDSETNLYDGLLTLRDALESEADDPSMPVVYVFSAFDQGSADLSSSLRDLRLDSQRDAALYASAPLEKNLANVQITTMRPVRAVTMTSAADGSGQIRVALRRQGKVSESAVSSLRVEALAEDASPRASSAAAVNWEAGQTEADVEVRFDPNDFESGVQALRAVIDRDVLEADNVRYTTFEVRNELLVGVADRREFGRGLELQNLPTGAWFRRALHPGEGSPVRVEDVDPSVIEPATIRDLDALVLCRPDLVTDAGWSALRTFVAEGGLLWLMPPAEGHVALWTDQAREALDLSWVWRREPIAADPPRALASEQPASRILTMLRGELDELSRPITIDRYLPLEDGIDADGGILQLADADSPGADLRGEAPGTRTGNGRADDDESEVEREREPGSDRGIENGRASANPAHAIWMAATSPPEARGLVVYSASPPHLAWTSLPAKPLMVALVQETVRQGLGIIRERRVVEPGDQPDLTLPASTVALQRRAMNEGAESGASPSGRDTGSRYTVVRENGRLRPARAITRRGLYEAVDSSGRRTGLLAVNVNPEAANIATQSANDVIAWLRQTGEWEWMDASQPAAALAGADSRAELSLALLLFVLVLAILETIFARRFSHAERRQAAGGIEAGAGATPRGLGLAVAPTLGEGAAMSNTIMGRAGNAEPASSAKEVGRS